MEEQRYLNLKKDYMITNPYAHKEEMVNKDKTVPPRKFPKVPRNEKCPCGSGKKFKKCHGVGKNYYFNTRDFYKFPLRIVKYGDWVYDDNSNFVFQFEDVSWEERELYIKFLNGEDVELKEHKYNIIEEQDPTEIFRDGNLFITMRGWGNLTGVGGYNLDGNTAAEIQDNFRDIVLNKLRKEDGNEKPKIN